MTEVTREVGITIDELREAALLITDALRRTDLVKLPRDQVPLVHAYMLGAVLRATGVARRSINPVLQFVEVGYNDFEAMKHEGASDE